MEVSERYRGYLVTHDTAATTLYKYIQETKDNTGESAAELK